jgi:hypothetical protein
LLINGYHHQTGVCRLSSYDGIRYCAKDPTCGGVVIPAVGTTSTNVLLIGRGGTCDTSLQRSYMRGITHIQPFMLYEIDC